MLDLGDAEPEPKLPFHLNGAGNVRFGADVIRGLGMLPESCAVVYETVVGRVSEPDSTPVPEPTSAPASEPRAQIVQDVDEGGQHPGEEAAPEDEAESLSEPIPEHGQQDVELSDDVQDDLNVPDIDDDAFDATDDFEATFEEEGDAFAYTPMTEDDFDGIMEAEYEIIEDDDSSEGVAMVERKCSSRARSTPPRSPRAPWTSLPPMTLLPMTRPLLMTTCRLSPSMAMRAHSTSFPLTPRLPPGRHTMRLLSSRLDLRWRSRP